MPSEDELVGDACLMLAAGMDTTAHALTVGTWHVLKNPEVLKRLRQELRQAMPYKDEMMDLRDLADLPYLVRRHGPVWT